MCESREDRTGVEQLQSGPIRLIKLGIEQYNSRENERLQEKRQHAPTEKRGMRASGKTGEQARSRSVDPLNETGSNAIDTRFKRYGRAHTMTGTQFEIGLD